VIGASDSQASLRFIDWNEEEQINKKLIRKRGGGGSMRMKNKIMGYGMTQWYLRKQETYLLKKFKSPSIG